ncbi:MAG: TRAP transporter TatT component family protein [Gammaproteobacteria bacterium]
MTVSIAGCGSIVQSKTHEFGTSLTRSIINYDDLDTVIAAIPAYLIMLDTLSYQEPDNLSVLESAALMNSSFLTLLSPDNEREKLLSARALNYSLRYACLYQEKFCHMNELRYEDFDQIVNGASREDVPALHLVGTIWATWIQANRENWNAIAQIAQVKLLMEKVVQLDENYYNGEAFVYLGIIHTLLPPGMGGTPEIGRSQFEKAIEISGNNNLMFKVIYARHYAKLVFDRKLHDELLNDVVNADPFHPNLTLINLVAQQQARRLLQEADDYF